jgi:hypothetical protein
MVKAYLSGGALDGSIFPVVRDCDDRQSVLVLVALGRLSEPGQLFPIRTLHQIRIVAEERTRDKGPTNIDKHPIAKNAPEHTI